MYVTRQHAQQAPAARHMLLQALLTQAVILPLAVQAHHAPVQVQAAAYQPAAAATGFANRMKTAQLMFPAVTRILFVK